VTPELAPSEMRFDPELAEKMTGLKLTRAETKECLARSRIGLDARGNALIPRYRVDILHPADLAEEVVIGYGLDRIEPLYPASPKPGGLSPLNSALDRISDSASMAGFIETMSYDLLDLAALYQRFSRSPEGRIEVENPRTIEHYLLRDSLLPSLMATLGRNVKAAYPQRIFEVGRVFTRDGPKIAERPNLAAVVAHPSSSYSEAKAYLIAIAQEHAGAGIQTRASHHWAFADGRCAEVLVGGAVIGHLGELRPSAVAAFGLDVPVAGFEIDLSGFL